MAKALVVPIEGKPFTFDFELENYDQLINSVKENISSIGKTDGYLDVTSFLVPDEDKLPHKAQAWVDDAGAMYNLPVNEVISIMAGRRIHGDVVLTETVGPETVGVSSAVELEVDAIYRAIIGDDKA